MRRATFSILLLCLVAPACSSGDDDGGGDPDAFCEQLTSFQSDGGFADLQPTDPEAVERVLGELHELEDLAPEEISAEVEVLTNAFEEFSTALAAGGGDLSAILDQVDDLQNARELGTAAERLAAYATDECGLDTPGATGS